MTIPNDIRARETYILEAVRAGKAQVSWAEVTSEANGHKAVFTVMADALRVDGVRVNCTPVLQQQIADLLGCLLLTPRLADLAWMQRAVKLLPLSMPISSTTWAMTKHSARIDAALAKLGNPAGLVSTVGKHWCLDAAATGDRAVNYGWHADPADFHHALTGIPIEPGVTKGPSGAYLSLIQGRGTAHNLAHVDYSQTCVLVSRKCVVDGADADLASVLQDAALAPLASHTGKLPFTRQPGVTELSPLSPSGPVVPPVAPTDPPPPLAPPAPATDAVLLPAVKMVASPLEVAAALAKAWQRLFGTIPSKGSIALLLAQWALETGRGRSMWCNNLGNVKSRPGDGRSWTYFACNEVLTAAGARSYVKNAGQRVDGKGPDAVQTSLSGSTATVWFYPDNAGCRFRAFSTLLAGAVDYLGTLSKRFSASWPAVLTADPAGFVHQLKVHGYFTASESSYLHGVTQVFQEFLALPIPLPAPGAFGVSLQPNDTDPETDALVDLLGAEGEAPDEPQMPDVDPDSSPDTSPGA